MAIYLTGDIHGSIDIRKLSISGLTRAGIAPTKDDYLVVCGDFGLIWAWHGQNPEERHWLRWLGERPFGKVLFVDGNHENFDRLNALPVEEWRGGLVHRITDKVYHLMRGQVFDIEGVRLLALGGARSTDRPTGHGALRTRPGGLARCQARTSSHGPTLPSTRAGGASTWSSRTARRLWCSTAWTAPSSRTG